MLGAGDAGMTDDSVVAAMERAIVCVKAWVYVEETKRVSSVPSPRAARDATEAPDALATATRLAGAADSGGARFRARKVAAERLQEAFRTNVTDAERGDRAAFARIEKALAETQDGASDWL
jgi:hypothetical protein